MCIYIDIDICTHHVFFIHSSVGGYLACLHVLAVVNSTVEFGSACIFELEFSPDICPGLGLLYHMVTLFSVFKRISMLFAIVAVYFTFLGEIL